MRRRVDVAERDVCVLCAAGYFKEEPGLHACLSCPPLSTSFEGAAAADDCLCAAGYYNSTGACAACALGEYKSFVGDNSCVACLANSATLGTGSASRQDCLCVPGNIMSASFAESARVLLSEGLVGEMAIVFCISFVCVTSMLMLASDFVLLAINKSMGNSEHEDDGKLQANGARFRGPQNHIAASRAKPTPNTPQPEGLRRRSSRNSMTSEDEAFLNRSSSCGSLESLVGQLLRNVSDTSLCSITEDSDFHPVGPQASAMSIELSSARRISSGTRFYTSCISPENVEFMMATAALGGKPPADANRTSRRGLGRSKSMSAISNLQAPEEE